MLRACLRATACEYQPYPRSSDCLKNYVDRLATYPAAPVATELYACVDRARSCNAVGTCFGARGSCDAGYQASCEEGNAVFCDLMDKRIYTQRCGAFELACQVDEKFAWSASCTGSGQPSGPLETGVDCDEGLCTPTGEPCGGADTPSDRCAGEQLESCLSGEWIRFDCERLQLGPCVEKGDTPATRWARCGYPVQ